MTSSGVMAMRRGRLAAFGSAIFVDRHRLGIDAGQLVGAELAEPRDVARADHHAVRVRPRRRRLHQPDLAGLRIEPADHVGALHGEPQHAAPVEHRRVRIARARVGQRIVGELAGLRIELADVAGEVAGEPDVAVLVGDEAVRPGRRCVGMIFGDLPAARIEPAEHVGHVAGVPDRAVRIGERIVRPRAWRRHHPFLDLDMRAAGDQRRRGLRLLREVLHQVVGQHGDLIRRHGRADVQHHVHHVLPVLAVVAGIAMMRAGSWQPRQDCSMTALPGPSGNCGCAIAAGALQTSAIARTTRCLACIGCLARLLTPHDNPPESAAIVLRVSPRTPTEVPPLTPPGAGRLEPYAFGERPGGRTRRSVAALEAGERLLVDVADAVVDVCHGVAGGIQDQRLGERGGAGAIDAVRTAAEEQRLGHGRGGDVVWDGAGCAVSGRIAAQSATRPSANAAAMMN